MAWIRRLNRSKAGLLLLFAATLTIVNASVFVYYTSSVSLQATKPPVYLEAGSNAGQPDLWGNTIDVVIGDAGASAILTLHPTYGKNYYKDVVRIVNQDGNNAYTVYLRVTDPLTDASIAFARVYVYDLGRASLQAVLDLKDTSSVDAFFTLPAGATYVVDVELFIGETGGSPDAPPSLADTIASFELIYTPSSEEPP